MKIHRQEIGIFILSAIATLLAVWFFLESMQKEQKTVQTDLYDLIAPVPHALLAINQPAVFVKTMLTTGNYYDLFVPHIPKAYLSILQNNPSLSFVLFSFHDQGVVFYAKANDRETYRIKTNTLSPLFSAYTPQQQNKNRIVFTYYPDSNNRFFGYYQYEDVFVASYSKKLLEEIAEQQLHRSNTLSPELDILYHTSNENAPVRLLMPSQPFNLYVQLNDSTEWRIRDKWLAADIFTSESRICSFIDLPYKAVLDTLYASMADTLSLRLQKRLPLTHISTQISQEGESIYFITCGQK